MRREGDRARVRERKSEGGRDCDRCTKVCMCVRERGRVREGEIATVTLKCV